MNKEQITRFIQFYERLTRVNLATLPNRADFVFKLDDTHSISSQVREEKKPKGAESISEILE